MPDKTSVVCTRLSKVVPNDGHRRLIEDAVVRVHRITIDATELLSLHLVRCLEDGRPLPDVTSSYVKLVMMEVSAGNGVRRRTDDELRTTREVLMPTLDAVSRKRLDQLLMAQSISLAAAFETNLWFHFSKRLLRYVRLHKRDDLRAAGMSSKEIALRTMRMADALATTTRGVDLEFDELSWVEEHRGILGTDVLTEATAECNARRHPHAMLRATWRVNRALEDAGQRTFACCPTRRQLRPAFANIDTNGLCQILGITPPKGKGAFAEAKNDIWASVVHLHPGVVRGCRRKAFAGSIRTDGVSARILFDAPAPKSKKRPRDEPCTLTRLPTRGVFAIDQVKHLSRLEELQLIGADPGKRELLVCVDPDRPGRTRKVRYTAAQRREETRSAIHACRQRLEMPTSLTENMEALSAYNSRSSYAETLRAYFQRRREFLPASLDHFESTRHRRRRWERHVRSQRSLTDFVRRVNTLRRSPDTPFALAYGSWGAIAGRPGAPCNRGNAPCIGRGLRDKLASHFLILSTPEAYTSRTCSLCDSECGPCSHVDEFHRARLRARAASDEGLQHASRFSVRGLRHCHNEACAAHLNRDVNAAINIQRRCTALLSSHPVHARGDEVDEQLDALRLRFEGG